MFSRISQGKHKKMLEVELWSHLWLENFVLLNVLPWESSWPCQVGHSPLLYPKIFPLIYQVISHKISFGSRLYKGLWCRVILNQTSIKGKEDLFSSSQMLSKSQRVNGYGPLDMVSLIPVEGHSTIRSYSINVVAKIQLLTSFCVYPARSLKTLHPYTMHHIMTDFPHTGFLIRL